jgi:hypothetical protein
MNSYKLAERAVLMRLSAGVPGKARKDRTLTESVKTEHGLGKQAGSWIKKKYPDWALECIEKVINEARAFHAAVTLPFDAGIGILPAPLIMEYGDRMRAFKGRLDNLIESHFKAKYQEMVEWARAEHNGSFDPSDYPPVDEVLKAFYFETEPLPVPDAAHFEGTVKSLLGVDSESVNVRVQDAMIEAQKELMRRLIEPVRAMAAKLSAAPKEGKDCPIFRDSLIGNLQDIAGLAPKLNIRGDAAVDGFAAELAGLARYSPDELRKSPVTRSEAATKAADTLKRLEGYNF